MFCEANIEIIKLIFGQKWPKFHVRRDILLSYKYIIEIINYLLHKNRFFMYAISMDIDFCIDLCIFTFILGKCRPQLIRIADWDNNEDRYLELSKFFIRKVNFAT